jgi:hypothetical protein
MGSTPGAAPLHPRATGRSGRARRRTGRPRCGPARLASPLLAGRSTAALVVRRSGPERMGASSCRGTACPSCVSLLPRNLGVLLLGDACRHPNRPEKLTAQPSSSEDGQRVLGAREAGDPYPFRWAAWVSGLIWTIVETSTWHATAVPAECHEGDPVRTALAALPNVLSGDPRLRGYVVDQ